jgi:hypothetical protein
LVVLGAKEVDPDLQRSQHYHDDAGQNEEQAGALDETTYCVAGKRGIGFVARVFAPQRNFSTCHLGSATGGRNEIGFWAWLGGHGGARRSQ